MVKPVRNRPLLYMMTWRCTRACNYNCLHCSFASSPAAVNEIDTKGGMRIVDELYEMGTKWFGLSGGEPLMRKDIFEIIEHAKSLGMNVSLITNGYYVKGDILDNLIRNEVMTAVSLDGTEETNDFIRGKGAYATAIKAMDNLSKGGIFDCIVTTLNKRNCAEVDHVAQVGHEYDATRVVYHNYVPVGRAQEHLELAPTPQQYEVVLNIIYDLMQNIKGNSALTYIVPSSPASLRRGVCPTLITGSTTCFLVNASSAADTWVFLKMGIFDPAALMKATGWVTSGTKR